MFKEGDNIICITLKNISIPYIGIDSQNDNLTLNKKYLVLGVSQINENYITINNDTNNIYHIKRFKLLNEVRKEKILKLLKCVESKN